MKIIKAHQDKSTIHNHYHDGCEPEKDSKQITPEEEAFFSKCYGLSYPDLTRFLFHNNGLAEDKYEDFIKSYADPLAQKYRSMTDISVNNVWKAQAWRQMAKSMLYMASQKIIANPEMAKIDLGISDAVDFTHNANPFPREIESLPKDLDESDIYLWTQETLDIADAMPMDSFTLEKDLLSSDAMFMVSPHFENNALNYETLDDINANIKWKNGRILGDGTWFFLKDVGDYLLIMFSIINGEQHNESGHSKEWQKDIVAAYLFPWGQTVGEPQTETKWFKLWKRNVKSSEDAIACLRPIVKRLKFLQMKLVEKEYRQTERAVRRQLQKEGQKTSEKPVTIIKLRRKQYKGENIPVGDGSGKEINWKGRWWVSGHWKNQPYGPKMGLRRPTYIETFAKGPEDMPFIEKAYVVSN